MASYSPYTAQPDPIPLSPRFAKIKTQLIACRERAVADSFYRLLRRLTVEADGIAACGTDLIPTIDYFDIHDEALVSPFKEGLRKRGVAVIRRVIPPTVAQSWKEETLEYVTENPQTRGRPSHNPQLLEMYWSPGQVRARADSRLLEAQRFAMTSWHSTNEDALVSGSYPVAYADRLEIKTSNELASAIGPHLDNGSVERWEPDGYGQAGTYDAIFRGKWEDYDPWDSSSRYRATTDLYNRASSCSMFRMFQGWLPLSSISPGGGSLQVCPMLQLTTAYLLLRPFFTPRNKSPMSPDFLHPNNWNLNVSQNSVLHGAVPGYRQELSTALHPHLQLHRTMVPIPSVSPGDYIIWHPDLIQAVSPLTSPNVNPPTPRPNPNLLSALDTSPPQSQTSKVMILCVPACPLTQTNALYLSRQRRAFLLGLPAPDFAESGAYKDAASSLTGTSGLERDHVARPGAQDISDAGGEEGLRSMGLSPWEDRRGGAMVIREGNRARDPTAATSKVEKESDDAATESRNFDEHVLIPSEKDNRTGDNDDDDDDGRRKTAGQLEKKEQQLIHLANGILFPDRFDSGTSTQGTGSEK